MYLHHTRYITQAISESIVVWRVHRNRFKYLLIVSEYLPHVSSYIHLSPENCSSIKNNTCAALQFLTLQDIVYIYIYKVYISILPVITFNKSNCGFFFICLPSCRVLCELKYLVIRGRINRSSKYLPYFQRPVT